MPSTESQPPELRIFGIRGLPDIDAGADLATMILEAAEAQRTPLFPGDVVVIAQKIVSKAEDRIVDAEGRDAVRAVARSESRRILRDNPDHLIVETRHGFVCANAGVDASNVQTGRVVLLPKDPDASASRIRAGLEGRCGAPVGVIIADTFGRPWRVGLANVAIGAAGLPPLRDYRGQTDPYGRELAVTQVAHIDELASATELVMGKLDRTPAAVVRGYPWTPGAGGATDLVRSVEGDLFR